MTIYKELGAISVLKHLHPQGKVEVGLKSGWNLKFVGMKCTYKETPLIIVSL